MTTNHEHIWPGGTYQSATPSFDPSLIELAVENTGQPVKRACASHLHRLHSNLSQDQMLTQICQDCPARFYIASQKQHQEKPQPQA